MSWTGWLTIATLLAAWLALQFAPELLKTAGIGLDCLPPKVACALLIAIVLAIFLAGIMIPAGSMKD